MADNFSATHLFRIVQEGVNNAIKHGRAGHIDISLSQAEHSLTVTVSDNGKGIEPNWKASTAGTGLKIMQYRADIIGASIEIIPVEPHGTFLRCNLPTGNSK